jgi:hypothetical protein
VPQRRPIAISVGTFLAFGEVWARHTAFGWQNPLDTFGGYLCARSSLRITIRMTPGTEVP